MNRDLDALYFDLWRQLAEGADRSGHPFHNGVLATLTERGVAQRTVVLRHADAGGGEMRCHTDRRSDKVREIVANDAVSWLFYDPESRVQLRLAGSADVVTDGESVDDAWRTTWQLGRRCYLADSPGEPRPDPSTGLPHALSSREPTEAESEPGRANFAVIRSRIHTLEWLSLRFSGHLRARFHRRDDGDLDATWLTP